MQALTSSFPSSTRGRSRAQLDNIIFYSGPAMAKTREFTPIDADEWPDVDMIFAEASQHEWVAATEHLGPVRGFDVTGEDIRNIIDTTSTAWTTISTSAHLEDVNTPLCYLSDYSYGGNADRGGSVKSQEPLGVWSTRVDSVRGGTPVTVQPDVQHNSGDVGIAVQDCPPNDGASIALWHAFRGEGSISVPATDNPTSPSRTLETDGPNLPLPATGLLPGSRNIDMVPSDKSLLEEGDCAQQPQLIDDRERNSTGPTVVESFLVEQDHISRPAYDMSANSGPSEGSTYDRAHSSHSAGTTDAANLEGSDSDGPPLARRRRQTLPRIRGSQSPSPPLTSRSSTHSTEMESTTALRRRKRVRRRKGKRRDFLAPETDDTSTNLTTSMSNKEGEWRPIQCFVQQKTMGSQEVINIQMPAFDLYTRSGQAATLSPSDDTSLTMPILTSARGNRRRARFSHAEEDLLIELKERRERKLSWREIQRHFPNRTIGSLQVHYSTHLKGQRPSRRLAV